MKKTIRCNVLAVLIVGLFMGNAYAEQWTATAYCSCVRCCGKSDGVTASGVKAYPGVVACNWLPFGTKLLINGRVYRVQDRGAKSIFGSKKNHIKRIDIFFNSHAEALRFGKRSVEITILKGAI